MADVNLDDLIKQDKEKNIVNKKKNIKTKFEKKGKFVKRETQDNQDNEKPNNRSNKFRGDDNNKNFKTKIINKRFNNQNNDRQDNRNNNNNNNQNNNQNNQNNNQNNNNNNQNNNNNNQNNQRKENFKNNKVQAQKTEENKELFFRTLKVMGLSPQFTNEDLYKLFATEGALEKCLIEQDNFGRSLTTALVKYHNPESARNAIQNLNKHKIMNCILTVQPYKNIKK